MHGYSIVIPTFQSEQTLPPLAEKLADVLSLLGAEYEIILVNDGSTDGTWQVITELAGKYPQVHGINLMRNYGQHNALLCGIRAARYDICITLDDDLQHPPEEIPKLIEKLNEGYDVVYGTPERKEHGLWRGFVTQVAKGVLQTTMGVKAARHVSPFRVFRSEIRQAFERVSGPYISIDVLLSWGTVNFAAVPTRHDARSAGKSNYSVWMLITYTVNLLTGFSLIPLRLASYLGFLLSAVGVLILIYVLGRFAIEGGSVPGFPFLASIITVFSGAQLFSIGVIGEYLARMHFRLMERPGYVVRTITHLRERVDA